MSSTPPQGVARLHGGQRPFTPQSNTNCQRTRLLQFMTSHTSQTKYSEPLNLVKLWMISTSEENLLFLFITAFVELWCCPFALYSWSCHNYKHLSKMFLTGSVSEIWENVSKIFCSFWRSAFAPAKAKDEWRWNFNLPENQNGFHNDEILSFANEGGGLSLGNHVANENHSWTAKTCFALSLV